MGRGGKASSKGDFKKRVRSKDNGSDDSDEDYVVSDEEIVVSEDELEDYCSSLDGDASEEGLDGLAEEEEEEEEVEVQVEVEEEEEEEEEEEVRKVVRSKAKKRNLGNWGRTDDKTSRKRKRVSYGEDEDYEEEDYEEEEDEDEDEEFTPDEDEDDCLDEEEELVIAKKKNSNIKKKKNPGRKGLRKKGAARSQKRRKSTVSKKPSGKKGRRTRRLRRKERCSDDEDEDDDYDCDFIDKSPVAREKSKKNSGQRKRKYVVPSDSDFVSSGPSDYEYTISEEEREQVREANELCASRVKTTLWHSSCSMRIEEDRKIQQRRKPVVRKGKEKIEEVKKIEGGKQVCGICLSEEDKRRLRGTLDCCSHYFCFTCIMEWSKVESRCPLCKQRFTTITKPERSTGGVDLRSVVIQVPKRDQVYQPTEEDLMNFIDPYENVLCSECHQGGDDALMLLCDVCDSPAHTYCVGLGRDVPAGNWYCYACRPAALGSTSSQSQDPLPDQRTTSNMYNRPSPIVSFGEGLDHSSVPSPRIPLNQGVGSLSSPRFTVGDVQAASPGSGAGAPTLSGRRMIQRHIQNLLNFNRTNLMAGNAADGMATANLSSGVLNYQIDQGRESVVQPARTQDVELSRQTVFEERLQENFQSSMENTELFASRLNHLRRQVVQDPTIATANGAVNLTLWPELAAVNSIPPYEQILQCSSIPNIGSAGCVPPITAKHEGDFYLAKEQLQSLVKSHLKNLSRDVELDNSTFKEIARSSTHTILAACGLEHRRSEVQVVHPLPSSCSHVERVAAGQTSLMKGFCSPCFDSYVKDVVKRILDTRLPQWLSLGL